VGRAPIHVDSDNITHNIVKALRIRSRSFLVDLVPGSLQFPDVIQFLDRIIEFACPSAYPRAYSSRSHSPPGGLVSGMNRHPGLKDGIVIECIPEQVILKEALVASSEGVFALAR